MLSKNFLLPLLILGVSCNSPVRANKPTQAVTDSSGINPYHLVKDIPLPAGYTRIQGNAFAEWLRKVELKKDKTVFLYNGKEKYNQSAQFAVLNISTGDKNLQQCADAVMRLRAEYLFAAGDFNRIVFTDNEGTGYRFTEPYTSSHLHTYLETVFGICGSASLSKELHAKAMKDIAPGDVLIKGGFPGHAVIVMDVAVNAEGKKIFLLAQGYMPAQDMHILVNPANTNGSPWYAINENGVIETPEYTFYNNPIKTW